MEEQPRGFVAFAGASISFFFVAILMKASGSATPANPAWPLVSLVVQIFIWPSVLLLGATVFAIPFLLMTEVCAHFQQKAELKQQKTLEKLNAITQREEDKRRQQQLDQEERNRQEQARLDAVQQQRKEEELQIQERNRRKARSPEDAIAEAMEDFG